MMRARQVTNSRARAAHSYPAFRKVGAPLLLALIASAGCDGTESERKSSTDGENSFFAVTSDAGYGMTGSVEPGTTLIFATDGFAPTRRNIRIESVEVLGLPPYVTFLGAVAVHRSDKPLAAATSFPPCYPVRPLSDLRLDSRELEWWYLGLVVKIHRSEPFRTTALRIRATADGEESVTTVSRFFGVYEPDPGDPIFDYGEPCERNRAMAELALRGESATQEGGSRRRVVSAAQPRR